MGMLIFSVDWTVHLPNDLLPYTSHSRRVYSFSPRTGQHCSGVRRKIVSCSIPFRWATRIPSKCTWRNANDGSWTWTVRNGWITPARPVVTDSWTCCATWPKSVCGPASTISKTAWNCSRSVCNMLSRRTERVYGWQKWNSASVLPAMRDSLVRWDRLGNDTLVRQCRYYMVFCA